MLIFLAKAHTVKRGTETVLDAGREPGVEADREDCKFICYQNAGQKHDMTVYKSFVNVPESSIQIAFIKK